VTANLSVQFRKPVPINTEFLIRARLAGERERGIEVAAEIVDGPVILAEARAALVHVPLEHFLATPEGRAAGEEWRRRLEP